jgi:hypothetical protein
LYKSAKVTDLMIEMAIEMKMEGASWESNQGERTTDCLNY